MELQSQGVHLKSPAFFFLNPNTKKSYKISQKLSPKHAARGVAQSPYPIYIHGKACLSKQHPWCAGVDPRLARGRSRVRAALRFFRTFSTKPMKVLGIIVELNGASTRVLGIVQKLYMWVIHNSFVYLCHFPVSCNPSSL